MISKHDIDIRNTKARENYTSRTIEGIDSVQYIESIINDAIDIDYPYGFYSGTANLALYYVMQNDKENAFKTINKLEQLLSSTELTKNEELTFYRINAIYYVEVMSDYNTAIDFSQKSLELAEQLGDKAILMRIKSNIGVIHQNLGNLEAAVEYMKESIEYFELNKDENHLVFDYFNLGDVYRTMKKYDLALYYLKKAYVLSNKCSNLPIWQNSSSTIITILTEQGDLEEANRIAEDVIESIEDDTSTVSEIYLIVAYASLLDKQGNKHEAIELMKKYEYKVDKSENRLVLLNYYELAQELASSIGRYDIAYRYLIKYKNLSAVISDFNSKNTMDQMLQKEYKKTILKLKSLANVGKELASLKDLDQVLMELKKILSNTIPIDSIGIGTLNDESIVFDHYFVNDTKIDQMKLNVNDENSLAAWCVRNVKPIIINDLKNDYRYFTNKMLSKKANNSEDQTINSLMYTPLVVQGDIIGVFTIQSYKEFAYNQEDMETFNIVASYVAIALKNVTQAIALEQLSITDSLTGLLNRRGFNEAFIDLICYEKAPKSIALVMLDLDLFKQINDRFGHMTGDMTLIEVSKILKSKLGNQIRVGRLGGEEFAFILNDFTKDEVITFAEELRQEIEAIELITEHHVIKVTTSIGMSISGEVVSCDYNQYYREADMALYQAKTNGRNQVVIFNKSS